MKLWLNCRKSEVGSWEGRGNEAGLRAEQPHLDDDPFGVGHKPRRRGNRAPRAVAPRIQARHAAVCGRAACRVGLTACDLIDDGHLRRNHKYAGLYGGDCVNVGSIEAIAGKL